MLYTVVFFIIAMASSLFAMLGLRGGMVYVPVLNRAGCDMVSVADTVSEKWSPICFLPAAVITGSKLGGHYMTEKARSKLLKIIYAVSYYC